jgi:hypothetical protein
MGANGTRLPLTSFRKNIGDAMIPLSAKFSYSLTRLPLQEEDVRDLLGSPVSALPPSLVSLFSQVSILMVPYLELANGHQRKPSEDDYFVTFEQPPESREVSSVLLVEPASAMIAIGAFEIESSDFHYEFYHQISFLAAQLCAPKISGYLALLREELNLHVHGEVDEESWQYKQVLLRRGSKKLKLDSKDFRDYAEQSFVDTMTLYLHGICCDIDVEPGPRQIPSRYLRKRLKHLRDIFPPPEGHALFPEDQDKSASLRLN